MDGVLIVFGVIMLIVLGVGGFVLIISALQWGRLPAALGCMSIAITLGVLATTQFVGKPTDKWLEAGVVMIVIGSIILVISLLTFGSLIGRHKSP